MTEKTADLRDEIAEALMSWAERNANPQYASLRRPETVRQNAYSRADAVLAVLAAPAVGQPAEAQAADAPLTDAERQFLTFALDLAADCMASTDGFTDEDEATLARFRRMAEEARS